MNALKQISAPVLSRRVSCPSGTLGILLDIRGDSGGCGHSAILGAAHKSSRRDLICRTWGSEQSSSITDAGRVNRQSQGKTWPYSCIAAVRVMRTLGRRSSARTDTLGVRQLPRHTRGFQAALFQIRHWRYRRNLSWPDR